MIVQVPIQVVGGDSRLCFESVGAEKFPMLNLGLSVKIPVLELVYALEAFEKKHEAESYLPNPLRVEPKSLGAAHQAQPGRVPPAQASPTLPPPPPPPPQTSLPVVQESGAVGCGGCGCYPSPQQAFTTMHALGATTAAAAHSQVPAPAATVNGEVAAPGGDAPALSAVSSAPVSAMPTAVAPAAPQVAAAATVQDAADSVAFRDILATWDTDLTVLQLNHEEYAKRVKWSVAETPCAWTLQNELCLTTYEPTPLEPPMLIRKLPTGMTRASPELAGRAGADARTKEGAEAAPAQPAGTSEGKKWPTLSAPLVGATPAGGPPPGLPPGAPPPPPTLPPSGGVVIIGADSGDAGGGCGGGVGVGRAVPPTAPPTTPPSTTMAGGGGAAAATVGVGTAAAKSTAMSPPPGLAPVAPGAAGTAAEATANDGEENAAEWSSSNAPLEQNAGRGASDNPRKECKQQ